MKADNKDILICFVMTAIYLALALFGLGNMYAPGSAWEAESENDFVLYDLGGEKPIRFLYVNWGLNRQPFAEEMVTVSVSYDGISFSKSRELSRGADFYQWKPIYLGTSARYIRFEAHTAGLVINEIAAVSGDSADAHVMEIVDYKGTNVERLTDEQELFSYPPDFMQGTYFDEIYHPRTALEYMYGYDAYEYTHPPLGKLIIGLGISIFGMNPFGWRIIGMICGALMIPIIYMLGLKLFRRRLAGFAAAFLFMFDFMHFTQTRMGTVDTYVVLFTMLSYYFMADIALYRFKNRTAGQIMRSLFLSGLFFGLACATKWNALYGGIGLAFIFFHALICDMLDARKVQSEDNEHFPTNRVALIIISGFTFFVLLPAGIYLASYLPALGVKGEERGLSYIISLQQRMYNYHSGLVAEHSFASPWYSWPISWRPVWYYTGDNSTDSAYSTIAAMGNPVAWVAGLAAVCAAFRQYIKDKNCAYLVPLAAYLSLYLPNILIGRLLFLYHYFPAVPFMYLCLAGLLSQFFDKAKNPKRTRVVAVCCFAVIFISFVIYYPVLSGYSMPKSYVEALKILPMWDF